MFTEWIGGYSLNSETALPTYTPGTQTELSYESTPGKDSVKLRIMNLIHYSAYQACAGEESGSRLVLTKRGLCKRLQMICLGH